MSPQARLFLQNGSCGIASDLASQDCFHMLVAAGASISPGELDDIFGATSGAGAGGPSWLRDEGMRRRGVYISQLQLSITKDRLEDFLESEADANVLEIVMCVDRATKQPNGAAFALFKDEASAMKATEHYYKGAAAIYGAPFIISTLDMPLCDDGTSLFPATLHPPCRLPLSGCSSSS